MSFIDEFNTFLDSCPTPMHFVQRARDLLTSHGFTELRESDYWESIPDKFFVVRDERCITAINRHDLTRGIFIIPHIDSPCFRAKPNTQISRYGLDQMRVAPYGGGLWMTWLDRDLKVAGRVLYTDNESGNVKQKLFYTDDAVATIPTLAIHLNRDLSTLKNFNLEDSTVPVLALADKNVKSSNNQSPFLMRAIAKSANIQVDDIIDFDAYLVDAQGPVVLGPDHDILSAPRLDDLSCAITALRAFVEADDPKDGMNVFAAFDAEEIGNNLRTGANSNFLSNILERLGVPDSFAPNSFIISADNTHAHHPNYPAKNEKSHPLFLGDGLAYSVNANSYFATEMSNIYHLRQLLGSIPIKPSLTRDDLLGGTTLGPYVAAKFGIATIDLGIGLLGMHSIHETCAVKDIETLQQAFKNIYNNFHADLQQ